MVATVKLFKRSQNVKISDVLITFLTAIHGCDDFTMDEVDYDCGNPHSSHIDLEKSIEKLTQAQNKTPNLTDELRVIFDYMLKE